MVVISFLWFKRLLRSQYTAGFAMMMASASSGTFTGWATAILPIFQSPDWPIPMDQSQIAWVLSIHFLGNILGAVPAGIFMDKFGRKTTLLMAGFTLPLTSWILVFVSTAGSLYHVQHDTVSNHGSMYHVESDKVSIPDSMYPRESDTVPIPDSMYPREYDTVSTPDSVLHPREFDTASIPDGIYHVESDTVSTPDSVLYPREFDTASIPDSMYHMEYDTVSTPDSVLYPREFDTASIPDSMYHVEYDTVSTPDSVLYPREFDTASTTGSLYSIESHIVSNFDSLNSMESSRAPDNMNTLSLDTVKTLGRMYPQLSVSTPGSLYSGELDRVSSFGSLDSIKFKVSTSADGWYSIKSTTLSNSYPIKPTSTYTPSITESKISNSPTLWYVLLLARLICGIWNGVVTTVSPIYLAEIAEPNCRGRLNTLVSLFFRLGNLLAILASLVFTHKILPFVLSLSSVVFLLVFPWLPETPYYLVKQGEYERAKKSLMWLRSTKLHRTEVKMEEERIWRETEGKVERKIWRETEKEEVERKIWGEKKRGIEAKVWREKCEHKVEMETWKWSEREGDMKAKVWKGMEGEMKDEVQEETEGEVKGEVWKVAGEEIEIKRNRETEREMRIKVWEDLEEIDPILKAESKKERQENIGSESKIDGIRKLIYLNIEQNPEKQTDLETKQNNKLDSKFKGEIEVKPVLEEKTITETKLVEISKAESPTESFKTKLDKGEQQTIPEVKLNEELLHKELESIQAAVAKQTEQQETTLFQKLKSKTTIKSLFIVETLSILLRMAGIAPIINYVADSLPGSDIFNPNIFVLLIEVSRLLSSLLSSMLVDKLPRRTLLIGASMICGCSMTIMTSFYLFDDFQKQNLSSLGINDHVEYMTNERDLTEVATQLAKLNADQSDIKVNNSSKIYPSIEYNMTGISEDSQYKNGVYNSRKISTTTKYNLGEISEKSQYNHGVNNSRTISTSTKYNMSGISENSETYKNGANNSRTIFTSTGHKLSGISENSETYKNGVNNSRTIFTSTGHNLSKISENSETYKNGVNNSRTIFISTKYNLSEGSEDIQYNMNEGNHFKDFTKIEDNRNRLSENIPNFLKWIPLTCIIIHGIAFSFGVATVCSNIRSELFPMNVEGHCSAITSIVTAMTSFGLSRSFPMTRNFMGLWFNFGMYALSSFLIALFAKFYLPETSGKSLQEIQDELESERSEKRNGLGIVYV